MRIEGQLRGSGLHPVQREDGAVDFLDRHGVAVLRYGELHVYDARERAIASSLEVTGDQLAILIPDDQDAVYPLTVDPLLTSPSWTAESNQAFGLLGSSVAAAGDVNGDGFSDVVVGAIVFDNGQANEGRAYLFLGSPSGLQLNPSWTAEPNQADARFGCSVGTAGDVNGDGFADVIVGAQQYRVNNDMVGAAFVYLGSAGGLAPSPAWTVHSQINSTFGNKVGTAGDVNRDGFSDVIVGAVDFSNGEASEGKAFVYHGSATGLSTSPAWSVESNQAGAFLGYSVATAGDVNGDGFADVIVGISQYDNALTNEGQARVYHGSPAGLFRRLTPGPQSRSSVRVLRHLGGDRRRRERRRVRRRHRRRPRLRQRT